MRAGTTTTLEEVCESVRYGYTASASLDPCGPRFLRITDIVPDSLDWESVPYCEIDDDDRERFALAVGDIVVARTGATVGYAKLIREPVEAVFASYLVRFRVNAEMADPAFIGRLIESHVYKAFVQSRIGGAAQPNASAPVLGSFRFVLPSKHSQSRIADILSAYDDLIENNRRRMALLEDAARQLYREWFVRLRFPGHEHTRITNGVPEGWERAPFESALVLQRGFDLPVQDREEGDVPIYGSTGINGFHSKAKVAGPGLVTGRSGTLGEVHYITGEYWPLNTALWVKEFRRVTPLFALFLMRGMDLKQYNGGVSVPTLDRKTVHRTEILIPSRGLLTSFDEFAESVFQQVNILAAQVERLRAARDLLLPRLMSGEIAV
ncbi:MAG: restriction endonuclease subunit S [Nitrospirota bacterium]